MEREPGTPLANVAHELFAQEVAKGRPLVQAYANAGYVADTGNACHLQRITAIQERIAELNAEAALRAGVSIERVLNGLSDIAFANMGPEIKAGDKLRALEGLGRHLGMFVDKTETKVGGMIIVDPRAQDLG